MNQTTKINDQAQQVLVVGGVKGIGLATVKALRAQGIGVIAADIDAAALQAVQGDHEIKTLLMDMTDSQSVKAALKKMPPLDTNKPGTYNVGATEFGCLRDDLEQLIEYAGSTSKVVGLPKDLTINTLRLLRALKLSPLAALPLHDLPHLLLLRSPTLPGSGVEAEIFQYGDV